MQNRIAGITAAIVFLTLFSTTVTAASESDCTQDPQCVMNALEQLERESAPLSNKRRYRTFCKLMGSIYSWSEFNRRVQKSGVMLAELVQDAKCRRNLGSKKQDPILHVSSQYAASGPELFYSIYRRFKKEGKLAVLERAILLEDADGRKLFDVVSETLSEIEADWGKDSDPYREIVSIHKMMCRIGKLLNNYEIKKGSCF